MNVSTFSPTAYFGSNMYLLTSGEHAAIIDPSIDFYSCNIGNFNVDYIILTHSHFDHIYAIESWVNNTNATVIVGRNEKDYLSNPYYNAYKLFLNTDGGYYGSYKTVDEGDELPFGDDIIKFIETPGHTSGSISVYADSKLFSGDLVFAGGGIGRTDLPSGDYGELVKSINKIIRLPDETLIYCGHGNRTTVKEIKRFI
jgi:glyoxylase-like metal-dependent hydrolase (beta-lactamase superfamily II)